MYVATIKKEALKFSSSHMTVFPDGTKEAIHGHNFRTEVKICYQKADLESMIPFGEIKKSIRSICQKWDEKLLLAQNCPFFEVKHKDNNDLKFLLCGKNYSVPMDEVVFLPCDNVTTENLAQVFCSELVSLLDPAILSSAGTQWLEVKIEEILGQGASFIHEFKK